MIIKPIYPKQIFKEPFHQGLITGMLIVGGIFWIVKIDISIGLIIFFAGVIIYRYYIQNMKVNNK